MPTEFSNAAESPIAAESSCAIGAPVEVESRDESSSGSKAPAASGVAPTSGLWGLGERRRVPELMDDPDLDPAEHERAMRGLARLNAISLSRRVVWGPLRDFARTRPGKPLRVLDVATGSGDLPIGLKKKADRAGVPIEVSACDFNPRALETAARQAAQAGVVIDWFELDALADEIPGRWDVIVSSLFLHHLDEAPAVEFLRKTAAACDRLIVNDLERGPLNYALVGIASRLLSTSYVVHVDGLLSVRAAFTLAEARTLSQQAGLPQVDLVRRFPGRWRLTWTRP